MTTDTRRPDAFEPIGPIAERLVAAMLRSHRLMRSIELIEHRASEARATREREREPAAV